MPENQCFPESQYFKEREGTVRMNHPADFGVRLVAILLDALIVGVPLLLISIFLVGDWERGERVGELVFAGYSLLVPVVWRGYTLGKYICRIRIQREFEQDPPHIGTMLLRNVVAGAVYGLTFGIGLILSIIMVFVREDRRSLHDFIAGTEVIYDERVRD